MARSAVRSGKFDARDRATKRRRDRSHRPTAELAPHDQLLDWLKERGAQLSPTMSLKAYLAETSHIDLSPAERLRRLAIEVERSSSWAALKQIYEYALRLEPDDAWVHASMGISCGLFAEHAEFDKNTTKSERLFGESEACFLRAKALDADDAHIRYAHGHLLINAGHQTKALVLLDEAIALDPEHGWARLYRAHCLHDLKRWREAVAAYDAVPRDAFKGPVSWRMDLLVEQQAFCALRAGEMDVARTGYETILKRYEAQPHLAQWGDLWYLSPAASDAFPELKPRIDALGEKLKSLRFPS